MPGFAVSSAALRSVVGEFINIFPQNDIEPPVSLPEDAERGNACVFGIFALFMAFPDIGLAMERSL
jgi:hypothetical protein